MSEANPSAAAPLVASLGDPAGVGPELLAAAWAERGRAGLRPFAVVGGVRLLASAAASRGIELPIEPIASLSEANAVFARALPVLSTLDSPWRPGEPDDDGALTALASL